jgi:hypothetical protein
MKLQTMMRNSFLLAAGVLAFSGVRAAAQTQEDSASAAQRPVVAARVTQAIDETQLVRFKGGVHRLARPEFDKGPVSDSAPMQRMLLLLRRSMDQESALTQLMVDQYNTNSPNYHKWLTPEQFGAQFGPADSDIQAVTAWLQSHGFQVAKVSKGKLAVEFSGTAAQVREAFHTEVHKFLVDGEMHIANASDPQIPAALAPVIHGLAPLHNFRIKPTHHVAGEFTKITSTGEVKNVKPEFTTSAPAFALGPTDFATIYNVLPLWNAAPTQIDGTGQSIAIIGVSNINLQDVSDFRTLFGLPTGGAANTPIVVIDGADPGISGDGGETEALLDVEWSGGVAKGAQIHFVTAADTDVAQGLILAIFRVIDTNSDPILSLSFGDCEPNEGGVNGAPGNNGPNGLWQPLWEQAAAQGITVTVSTGDNGSAGCDNSNAAPPNPAIGGLQVSGLASTPFNVAVGGTDFNDAGTQPTFFNATNDPNTLASAKSYIPETTWNQSCTNAFFGANAETNCNTGHGPIETVGGSGGASHCFSFVGTTCTGSYPKPAYQLFAGLTGMPTDGERDLPDVSLFASAGGPASNSFYVVCERDAVKGTSCNKSGSFSFLAVGGTSASTPSFAGIMALVNQVHGRQGNANFVLYKLAQVQFAAGTACNTSGPPNAACTFNDTTAGTIAMPCTKGTLNCTVNVGADTTGVLSGFSTTIGYDLATGLGSVNANNLVNNWATKGTAAFTPTTVALTLSPTTGITAGSNVTVNITVTPTTATGDVALVSTAATGQGVDGFPLASGKVVNGMTNQLTGGSYQVTARYSGDGTFAPSVSTPVNVTVNPAASTTRATVLVNTINGLVPFSSGAAPVTLFLVAAVNQNGNLTPTGTVTFKDTVNGVQTTVATTSLNQVGEAFTSPGITTFGAGTHSLIAVYSGDPSFTTSTSASVAFTITGGSAGTFTVNGSTPPTIAAGTSQVSTITVTPSGGFTGMVNVTCPTAGLPAGVTCSPNPLSINVTTAAAKTGQLTIAVAAPSTTLTASAAPTERTLYAAGLTPPSGGKGWWTLSAGTGLAAMLLLFMPGRKRYYTALGLVLVCALSFTLGCGGGGGGGGGGGPVATITKLTLTAPAKVPSGAGDTFAFTVAVTGGTPTGQVQLFDGATALGAPVSVVGGSAPITTNGLPVGTHSISAHYLGTSTTMPSQTAGAINVTVTGTTNFVLSSTPASSNANPTVNITIN